MTESDRHDTPTGDRRISEGAGASPDESNPTDFAPEEFTPAYTPPLARSGTERPSFGRPAADNKELQERVDNLTARNAKLLDTLKDARQQLSNFRQANQIIDPTANVAGQAGILTTLEEREAA